MSPQNANPDTDLGNNDRVLGGIYFQNLADQLRQLTGDGVPRPQCFYTDFTPLQAGAIWHPGNQVMIWRESFEEREVLLGLTLPDEVKQMYVRRRQKHVNAGRGFELQDPFATVNGTFVLVVADHKTYQWVKRELKWLKRVCYACYER
jgi:hypothetical protein